MRHITRAWSISALAGLLAVSCSTSHRTATPTATTTPTTGSSVANRAPNPTQTDAPGIQFTKGALSVTLYGHSFQIAARDWNTITDKSVVPRDIGVSLDSNFHAAQTTRNRFQYLADRMFPFIRDSFGAIGVVSVVKHSDDTAIVALINPTGDAYQLSGFTETITESPPATPIASAKFYTTPTTALVVPGDNIYFVRLSSPAVGSPPPNPTKTNFNFGWDRLHNCGQAACPQPSSN